MNQHLTFPRIAVLVSALLLYWLVRHYLRAVQRREAQLRVSEERFRSWIEYSSDLVTVTDEQGIIRFESHSSERLLGYAPEELVGRDIFDLVHPNDQNQLAKLIHHDRGRSNGMTSAEFRLRHRDGSWHDFEGIRRTYVEDGAEPANLINSRDITEPND